MSRASALSLLWPGVPLALGSAVLFGATAPLSKLLLESINPFLLAGLLYLGAGVGLGLYRLMASGDGEARLTKGDLPWLALAIGFGGVIGPILLMFGLMRTTASSASLLLNVEGLATMAIAWLVYRENVDRRLLAGAFAILAGAVLISWEGDSVSLDLGALLVIGACVSWGIDNNVTRRISAADPVTIAILKGLVAGVVNFSLGMLAGSALPATSGMLLASALGFVGIGVSLVMFIFALRHIGTARTGAYYSLAPFVGALLSIAVLDEPLTARIIVAGALMAVGLWLHLSERHDHEHDHERIEHEHAHVHDEHHQHHHDVPVSEPHTHWHVHKPIRHKHPHFPDLHHRHSH